MNLSVRFKRALVFLCLLGNLLPGAIAYASGYTVVPGDSLYSISQKFHVTVNDIRSANGVKGDLIYPGQVLNIPDGKATSSPAVPVNAQTHQNSSFYVVKPGDSLYLIAQKYNTTVEALMAVNNLQSSLIVPGQQLNVPVAAYRPVAPVTEVSRSARRPEIPFSDADLDLLARLVTAEAGGEPKAAQVGVAAVVVNRVKSSLFPNSIREVIYAPNQFTPVSNGWINRPATAQAVEAAREALYGADPTNGALYFFDTSAKSSFLHSLPVSARYGKMIYAKAI